MHRLSSIVLFLIWTFQLHSQSPHGELFVVDCASCHNPDGWTISIDTFHFNHDTTNFTLKGIHQQIDCKECHSSLIFNDAPLQCASCHLDIHNMSVGNDCARCHTSQNWLVDNIPEIHESAGFPLLGSHGNLSCVDCHFSETNLRFDRIGNDCISCHRQDFEETVNPDHKVEGFSTNCIDCHDPLSDGWETEFVNHDFFPLTLGHDIQNCKLCHITDKFSDASPECLSCHTADFNASINPNHQELNLSNDCATCHTTDPDWMPASFDVHNDFYPLLGAHAAIANDCVACHNGDYLNTPNTCIGCHADDFNNTTDPNHAEANFSTDCTTCHSEDAWKPATFDHNDIYPLLGAHASIANDCAACHSEGFVNTPNTCVACHQNDYDNTSNPNHEQAQFNTDCTLCHGEDAWTPSTFDHDGQYFPIYSGAHEGVWSDCIECHTDPNNYANTSCINCHINPETDDEHIGVNGYVYDDGACLACHPMGDADTAFDHNATNFPLTGSHIGVDCLDCHSDGFQGTSTQCVDCHTADFNASINPNHQELNLSNDCAACHTTDPDWMPASFDVHNDFFPLLGAHAAIANDCVACHNGDYLNTPNTCIGCHADDFNNTTDPNHTEANFSTDCTTCHSENAWKPATFDHDDIYPLLGAHATIANDCAACHSEGFVNTPNTCVACHQSDYDNTSNPNHEQAQFNTDCTLCHGEDAWTPSTFDHDGQYFPIYSGAHEGVWSDCIECHTDPNNYANTSCINCHINPETDDEHIGVNGYVYDDGACLACHPMGDADTAFDHNATNFPLTGSHIGVDCLDCHSEGFQGTSTQCVDCHTADFNASINPNHQELNLSNDCATCHTTDPDWMPASFDVHNDFYPLLGAHAAIANDCVACHNGDYLNTPNTCIGCHADDFNNTTDPNHAEANFSTDCTTCHSEDAWKPATFDHNDIYPLLGAHAAIANDCAACHSEGFVNTPNTCVACHQNDYDNTSNPNHEQAQFNTDCTLCHVEDAWTPSTFDHDGQYFPIYSGAHEGVWSDCIECHTDPNNYANTSCINCHINPETDDEHIGVNGYVYDDGACLACHPMGDADTAFDHNATNFPLTGSHIGVDCLDCHSDGFQGTSTQCVDCHTADFNASINPNHQELNLSNDCAACHTTDPDWMPASFDVHNDFYPLLGAHAAIANDCVACHNGDYINTPNTCIGCHVDDFNNTTDPNHAEANFSTDCTTCHSEDAWKPATFDHNDIYPLLGAHATIANDCAACHSEGFVNTPNTCVTCHQSDYDDANNPNHRNAQFPTDCTICHNENRWEPSNFDHDDMYFPIYSGTHRNEWDRCTECHIGGNYSLFSCIDCHEHNNKNDVDDDHDGVSGYRYESNACYSCHPNGEE